MFCGNCGTSLKEGSKFCPQCGSQVKTANANNDQSKQNKNECKRCPECNNIYDLSMVFCDNCGTLLKKKNLDNPSGVIMSLAHVSVVDEKSLLGKSLAKGQLNMSNSRVFFEADESKKISLLSDDIQSIDFTSIKSSEVGVFKGKTCLVLHLANGKRYLFSTIDIKLNDFAKTINKHIWYN